MPEELTQDMIELLQALNTWRVEYLIVGAHALGIYTQPAGPRILISG